MRRRNHVFALKKHEGHCSILRSNALFSRERPVFTLCRLLSSISRYFIPSVSYPFHIHFISVSYFQLQGDWMRFERGLLNSQKLHAELHRKMRCVLQQVLLIF